MQISRYLQLGRAFEIAGSSRMLPLEGLRAIAVTLVFVQHYCMQFITYGHLSGLTLNIAIIGRNFGNCGVELFFVLSGFLIYGILLRRRPPFFDFMGRRLQRLYPAFLVSVILGIVVDLWRSDPKIPGDLTNAVIYLTKNLLFLPGLLPVEPVSAPNWSLSYEWWFYTTATLLFSVLGLARLRPAVRVSIISLDCPPITSRMFQCEASAFSPACCWRKRRPQSSRLSRRGLQGSVLGLICLYGVQLGIAACLDRRLDLLAFGFSLVRFV